MNNCQELMTQNPTCCLADDKVNTIAQRMQKENIGSLPVVENHQTKKLIGIVTDRDLALRVVGASRDATRTKVIDVMTAKPLVCHPTDDLNTAMTLMANEKIRRIPVVDEEGHIVGIIAQADIALQLNNPDQVGKVIEQISQPDLVASR